MKDDIETQYREERERTAVLRKVPCSVTAYCVWEELESLIDKINNYDKPSTRFLTKLRPGKDQASYMTPHDIRRRIDKNTIQLVQQLYTTNEDQLNMYRWLVRGLHIYPAYLKVYHMNLTQQQYRR